MTVLVIHLRNWDKWFSFRPSQALTKRSSDSDFLLFMPAHNGNSPLEAAWSFYASIVTVSSEGDSVVSDDTLEGLGTTGFTFQALFGTLVKLASQPPIPKTTPKPIPPPSDQPAKTLSQGDSTSRSAAMADVAVAGMNNLETINSRLDDIEAAEFAQTETEEGTEKAQTKLTQYLPAPGYFLAGAISGGVSRTATAPLDRLKVYLLVNTHNPVSVAVDAAKHGKPVAALKTSYKPISDAVLHLWKAGGIRTFFAGKQAASSETR
jgi:solute carrier family 25 phosphate transporter 23/24/25/41